MNDAPTAEDSVNNFWDTQYLTQRMKNIRERMKILEELVAHLEKDVQELKELHR